MRPDSRQRMWTVVRKLPPPVTAGDVEQLADVPAADVEAFLAELVASGRLALRSNGYMLLKDHGPLAPASEQTTASLPGKLSSSARDLESRAGPMLVLEAVLAILSGLETVSLAEAVAATGLPRRKVLRVLDRLTTEGRLELVKDVRPDRLLGKSGPVPRELVYRVVATAHPAARPVMRHADSSRDRAWAAMRRLRRFTRADVVDLCGCHPDVADDLVKLLVRDGYLECVGFQERRRKVMVLVRDPGPVRPRTLQPRSKEDSENGRETTA